MNDTLIFMLNFIKNIFAQIALQPETALKDDRHLLIMRHASSDMGFGVADIDRPLNPKGLKEPTTIAYCLDNQKIVIDKALVSVASRASKTYEIMRNHLKHFPEPLLVKKLYNAWEEDVLLVLRKAAKDCERILLVGHNPSVSEVTLYLTGESHEFEPANLAILTPKEDSLLASLENPNGFNFERMV